MKHNSIFQSELLAFEEEIYGARNSPHTEFLIFIDSLSGFQTLEISDASNSNTQIPTEFRQEIFVSLG